MSWWWESADGGLVGPSAFSAFAVCRSDLFCRSLRAHVGSCQFSRRRRWTLSPQTRSYLECRTYSRHQYYFHLLIQVTFACPSSPLWFPAGPSSHDGVHLAKRGSLTSPSPLQHNSNRLSSLRLQVFISPSTRSICKRYVHCLQLTHKRSNWPLPFCNHSHRLTPRILI